MLTTILIVLLIVVLLGGLVHPAAPPQPGEPEIRPIYYGYGFGNVGGLLIVIIIAILLLGQF